MGHGGGRPSAHRRAWRRQVLQPGYRPEQDPFLRDLFFVIEKMLTQRIQLCATTTDCGKSTVTLFAQGACWSLFIADQQTPKETPDEA